MAVTPAAVRSFRLVPVIAAALGLILAVALLTGHHASARAGQPVPDFSLPALDPGAPPITRQSLRGRPAVLLFWASWCEPCQRELPEVTAEAARLGDRVQVVGIDTNDRRDDATAFLTRTGVTLLTGFDDTGTTAAALQLYGLPAAVYLTADGVVSGHHIGPVTAEDLDRFAGRS